MKILMFKEDTPATPDHLVTNIAKILLTNNYLETSNWTVVLAVLALVKDNLLSYNDILFKFKDEFTVKVDPKGTLKKFPQELDIQTELLLKLT